MLVQLCNRRKDSVSSHRDLKLCPKISTHTQITLPNNTAVIFAHQESLVYLILYVLLCVDSVNMSFKF